MLHAAGYADLEGPDATAAAFQQFLDRSGKTLAQQGAGEADMNALLDFFASRDGSGVAGGSCGQGSSGAAAGNDGEQPAP